VYEDLAKKTAIITGGARGQGASHARTLARHGVNIVVADIRDELGAEIIDELRSGGHNATYRHLDVRSTEDWAETVAAVEAEFGAVNILVNNAGITQPAAVDVCTDAEWDDVINTNLAGTFKGMRAVVPAMRRVGGGVIVNISSIFGIQGGWGYAGYIASKFGVTGITKSAALTYAAENIRVNAIAPSSVDTPMLEQEKKLMADNPYFDFDEWMASQPIPRVAQPDEISDLLLYLLSERSRYCTGGIYPIDGGILAG
jgi:3alpha(or 20beta)-hydroxysteroid dehydrogenase